jgi:hypothetical protein
MVVEDCSELLLVHGCRERVECVNGLLRVGREDRVAGCVDGVVD